MSKKKDSAFYNRKAQVLRDLGIEAQPVKELVTIDITYNENQVEDAAKAKGMSVDDFIADVDKQANGEEDATMPGVPRRDLDEFKKEVKGETVVEDQTEEKEVVSESKEEPEPVVEPEVEDENKESSKSKSKK